GSSGCDDSLSPTASSQRFCKYLVGVDAASGTGKLHVMLEPAIFRIPPVRADRLESFDRERPIDDRARLGERTDRAGGHHLQADVAEGSGLGRTRGHDAAGGVGGPLLQEAVSRSATDHANLVEAAASELLER